MLIKLNFRSNKLQKSTNVNIVMPEPHAISDKPYKVLWLLHGLSDDESIWVRQTSIERYATEYNIAVIMPDIDRSWYTDTAYDSMYFSYLTEELPKACFDMFACLSQKRENNIIGGLSMGGYGALKASLTCPEKYGACISLSGALDITRKNMYCNVNEWRSIFNFELKNPCELEGTVHDLFYLATKDKNDGKAFPKIYMWCGTEDSLIVASDQFSAHLNELGVSHTYETSEGNHSWPWWDKHIVSGLNNVL